MQYQKRAPLNRRGQLLACFVLGMVLLTCLTAWSAENDTSTGVLRSRVYKFNHITSQQAQEFFSQLGIGQKYNALTPEVLIVTSNTGTDLVRAMEVKNVIDQEKPVQVRVLTTGSASEPLPPLDAFSAGLTSVTVGTMSDAPPREAFRPVIVDVLDNQLIAIATEEILNEVAQALDKWKTEHPAAEKQAPEAGMNTPAEKPAEKPDEKPAVVEPNQPPTPAVETAAEREIPEKAPEAQVQEVPLEQVAEQLSGELMVADANESASEPMEEGGDDDFMGNELLDALDQAQQDQPVTEVAESVPDAVTDVVEQKSGDTSVADSDKPSPAETLQALQKKAAEQAAAEEAAAEQAEADRTQELMQKLQALMGQSQQEAAGPESVEDSTGSTEVSVQPDMVQAQKTETVEGPDPIEAELKMLREKLTALEAEAAERPQQTTDVKIQTAEGDKKIVTKPTIETGLAEEELETVMDLPQEVELESLIDLVGKQLGLNYMYDPVILKNQKVQLKVHGGRIKVKDVYSLLESVLKLKGFVMTRENQLVTIVKAANADQAMTQVDPVIRTPGEPIQAGNVIVSTLFTLDNISTETAKNMLMSLKLGMTNGFQEIPETGTLLVTDYAFRMGRIEEVLSIIDVPGEKKEYKFRTLKYMSPTELVSKLQELAGQLEDVSLQITTQAAATPQRTRTVRTRNPKTGQIETKQVPIQTPGKPAASAAQQPESPDSVYIDTDDRTNRILMAGKPDQISLVNELIDALDIPQYDLKYVREYIIENVEAQDVVDVINELGLASVSVTTDTSMTTTRGRTTTHPRTPPKPVTPPQSTTAATQPGQADQPYISIRSATNSLLVNATAEQHEAIELAIAHVDVVQVSQRTIRQYEIQYVDAQEVIDTLVDLQIIAQDTASTYDPYSRSNSRSSRSSRQPTSSRTNQPQPMFQQEPAAAVSLPTAEGGSEKEITADQPQISVLETTNSLLVFATPKQHEAIALVIAYTDQEITTKTTPYVVYALENQDPVELSEVLTKLIQETVEESGKTSTPDSKIQRSGTTPTGTANLPTLEEEKIRIIADEMSYSLIVYANKRNQQWIAELVNELDEYRPQVLLDCTLVEVTQNERFEYDLDILGKTYNGAELISGQMGTELADFSVTRYGEARSTTSGDPVFRAFFNSQDIQGLLTAIQTKGYGRVMSRPKILVNDNQEGEIKAENQTSIAQQKSQTIPGTDGSQNIVTQDVSFAEYTSGVTLSIKPHISKGEMLRLEILLNRIDFDFSQGKEVTVADETYPRPPDLLSTDVKTVATVPDGTTIVLGGLESIKQSKGNSKIPLLGDLPLVGGLFRGVTDSGEQGKLYVFVKANILRPGDQIGGLEDIRRVSSKDRAAFEDMERQFQELQDWPGVDPKPMEPVKVLEEDEDILGKLESKPMS